VISEQKLCGWAARLLDDGNIRMEIVGCGRLLDGKEVPVEEAKESKAAASLLSQIVTIVCNYASVYIIYSDYSRWPNIVYGSIESLFVIINCAKKQLKDKTKKWPHG
jgi:hypothetical protein